MEVLVTTPPSERYEISMRKIELEQIAHSTPMKRDAGPNTERLA